MASLIAEASSPSTKEEAQEARAQCAALGQDILQMQADLERSIQLGGLRNDPLLPLLRSVSASLALQWRLHDQAMRHVRSTREGLDQQLAQTLVQGEKALEARRLSVVESLAPALTQLMTQTLQSRNRSVTLKTISFSTGLACVLAFGVGLAGYGMGWQAGRNMAADTQGVVTEVLHLAGPKGADALADMIRANNVGDAWATCQKTAIPDKTGQRVCMMPMWADALGQPGGSIVNEEMK